MGISVLYVDDEPALLQLGRLHLERIDPELRISGVNSADEALAALEAGGYDAIVADYQMPGHDGLGFLREVRSRHGRLPFILLTGHGREEVAIEALNLGADFYLQKGGSPRAQYAELAHRIRAAVERRRDELALSRSEARFRSYFQIPLIGIAILGDDGGIREANRKAHAILGHSADGLSTLSWFDLFASAEQDRERDEFRRALTDPRGCVPREVRIDRGDGLTADVVVSMAPVRQDGESTFLVALIEDVTEQRQTARALREREAGYRAVVEAMAEGLLIHVDGCVVFMNTAAARILGLNSPSEGVSRPVLTWIHPDDGMAPRSWPGRCGAQHVSERGRLVRTDGRPIEVEMTAAPVGFQSREAIQVVFRDVTDACSQARALAESEERYRAVFERAGEGIMILTAGRDDPGRIVAANQAAAACYGRSTADLVGLRLDAIEAGTGPSSMTWRLPTLEDGAWLKGTTDHMRPDRTLFPVDYSIGLVEYGGSRHALAFIWDRTDQRMAEAAAQRANEKLSLLSSITRHDILNQVTALLLYLELSSEDATDPVLRSYVEKELALTRNIQRLISFTKDYQDLGAEPPAWQSIDEVVHNGLRMAGQVRFALECEPMPYEVYADPVFARVFTQLAMNTSVHAPTASRLHVRANEGEHGLVIACDDDGPGLSEQARRGCFKRRADGTGWGLCLCRDILSITGIEIREAGGPASGAYFELLVPMQSYRHSTRGA